MQHWQAEQVKFNLSCYLYDKSEPLIQVSADWFQNAQLCSGPVQGEILWICVRLTCKKQKGNTSNIRVNIQSTSHDIGDPEGPFFSIKVSKEPTNQDVIKNARSLRWGLDVSVHVHSTDRWGHIQWVQFNLHQRRRWESESRWKIDVIKYSLEQNPPYPWQI